MSRANFYKYAMWGLVVLNIAILAFFLMKRPHPRPPHPSGDVQTEVIDMLHLDSQQEKVLKKLAAQHIQQMKAISERQKHLLLPYFGNLDNPTEQVDRDSLLNLFQEAEREKIELTYQHFEEIKEMLHVDQLAYFEGFMKRISGDLLLGNNKNQPPPKDFK